MDHGNGNCYDYGRFSHLTRNYRNRREENRIGERRRLKYRKRKIIKEENRQSSNLNGEENLIVFD